MRPGWREVTFSEACSDVSSLAGKLPTSGWRDQGELPVVDQGDGAIAGYTDDEALPFRGDLPVIVFGDHTRRFKFVDHPFVIGADGVKILQPSSRFDPRFLYWFLASCDLPSAGYSRHFKFLKDRRVPLPPIEEQRRIARVLDAASDLVERHRCGVPLTLSLLESQYVSTCGRVTDTRWPVARLDELATVTTGNTPPRADAGNYGDAIEWVKNEDVQVGWPYVTTSHEGLSARGASRARIAQPGSVLVTCISGSPAAIGRVALADRPLAFNQQINSVTPHEIEPSVLYLQLRLARDRIRRLSTGGMKGMISKSALQGLEVRVPASSAQADVSEAFTRVVTHANLLRERGQHIDALFASLQHRAFIGAL